MDKKATTLIERFGFKDRDLTTPEHDKMLLWILDKKNSLSMLKTLGLLKECYKLRLNRKFHYECDWSWETMCCSGNCKKEYASSYRPIEEINKKMKEFSEATFENYQFLINEAESKAKMDFLYIEIEHAILGYNNYNIGFIDAVITISNYFECRKNTDACCFLYIPFEGDSSKDYEYKKFYVEIKPKIDSIGELIRQINMYRSHVKDGCWIVVTQTPNLKQILGSQDIFVYEWKENP